MSTTQAQTFSFFHWDPDGALRRFLDRWFPPGRLSLGAQDPYRASGAGRQGPDVQWPKSWGRIVCREGPYLLSDPEVGLPLMPWQDRPPLWVLNSLWVPTGASRCSVGLFLSDQQQSPGASVDFQVHSEGDHPRWKLYVLAQWPFTVGQNNQSWLTLLVDRRYFDRDQAVVLPREKTLRPDDLLAQDLIDALPQRERIRPADLSRLADAGPLNAYVWLQQWPAGVVLDALAALARLRVLYDLETEQYLLQSAQEAADALQDNLLAVEPIAHFLPTPAPKVEKVTVSFPIAVRQGYKLQESGPTYFLDTLHPRRLRQSQEISLGDPGSGRTITAWTSCPLLYEAVASGVPPAPDRAADYVYGDQILNGDAVDAVLERIRGYYLDWVHNARIYHFSLPLTARWTPTGFDDYLWISYDQRGQQYYPKQIVSSLPPDCFPTQWPFGQLAPGRDASTSFWAVITGAEEVVPGQRWAYTLAPTDPAAEGVPAAFEAKNVLEYSGAWYEEQFFPIPMGTSVRVWKTEWIENGQPQITYWFSYPLRPKGVSTTLHLLGIEPTAPGYYYIQNCSFYKGHLFTLDTSQSIPLSELGGAQPGGPIGGPGGGQQPQPGQIVVGGNIVPDDPVGRFFPIPGLWNGMPQWQSARDPYWLIRWVLFGDLPGWGRWVLGWWPPNAQQGAPPQRGFAQRPPQQGQPPKNNPIGEFPEQIGDVEGEASAHTADYVLQDCTETEKYYLLENSGFQQWPLNSVIRWTEGGAFRCGKVIDFPPDLPGVTRVKNWRAFSTIFYNCNNCGSDYILAECGREHQRYLLRGSGSRYYWEPGQVIKWAGPFLEMDMHCGKVLPFTDSMHYTHEYSENGWVYLGTMDSCEECGASGCPSNPSCPSYPAQPPSCEYYCPCLKVSGTLTPSDAQGVYTVQETLLNGYCWWKKDNWAIYYWSGSPARWYLVNLNNQEQYWHRSGAGNPPWGVYTPNYPAVDGFAYVGFSQ